MANILIAGCGDVGSALARRLSTDGHRVWRFLPHIDALAIGVQTFVADLTAVGTLQILPPVLDFVFYTAAPDTASDDGYRGTYVDGLHNGLTALTAQGKTIRRIFFNFSTGVYAQCAGEWVDELSPTQPQYFSGLRMLEAERLLLESRFSSTIVRLGGVDGPGRTGLIQQVRRGTALCQNGPPMYTNRICRADCVGVLYHLMALPQLETLYLDVAYEPADQKIVYSWLARHFRVVPLRTVSLREGQHRVSNRLCRNTKLTNTGHVFRYPSFRQGYAAVLGELEMEVKNG